MNTFRGRHPFVVLTYCVGFFVVLMYSQHPLIILSAALIMITLMLLYMERSVVIAEFSYAGVLGIILFIVYIYTVHNGVTPILYINGLPLTIEAIVRAVAVVILFMTSWLSIFVFAKWLSTSEWFYLLSRFSANIALSVVLVWRIIPIYKQKYVNLYTIQRSLLPAKLGNVDKTLLKWQCVCQVFRYATADIMAKTDHLRLRGYRKLKRTFFHLYMWRNADTWMIGWLVVTLLFFLWEHMQFYYFPSVAPIKMQLSVILGQLFLLTPLLVEVKGLMKWNRLS